MVYHEDSARIVSNAIQHLGLGNKGLAEHLKKNPSLVSRYASGEVRPKAETLLKCIEIVRPFNYRSEDEPNNEQTLQTIKNAITQLSPIEDKALITAIFSILTLAKKL